MNILFLRAEKTSNKKGLENGTSERKNSDR